MEATDDIKFYGIIGDMNPIEHTGGVVFDQGHGPELIYFQDWNDGDGPRVSVYTLMIEENLLEELDWVDWKTVASCVGLEEEELKAHAISDNVLARAQVYQEVAAHGGWRDFDDCPRELTLEEAEEEYEDFVNQAHAKSQRTA